MSSNRTEHISICNACMSQSLYARSSPHFILSLFRNQKIKRGAHSVEQNPSINALFPITQHVALLISTSERDIKSRCLNKKTRCTGGVSDCRLCLYTALHPTAPFGARGWAEVATPWGELPTEPWGKGNSMKRDRFRLLNRLYRSKCRNIFDRLFIQYLPYYYTYKDIYALQHGGHCSNSSDLSYI